MPYSHVTRLDWCLGKRPNNDIGDGLLKAMMVLVLSIQFFNIAIQHRKIYIFYFYYSIDKIREIEKDI